MIDVKAVLRHIPHFERFCSVRELHALAAELRSDARFEVRVAGTSGNGLPIHHIRFGRGAVRALFLGFPHACEPIGGLTIYSLLRLLQHGPGTLLEGEVEWHFVPCADPDATLLNEVWNQNPTFEGYLRNYHMQRFRDQAAMSYPISHKRMTWSQPSHEARIVMSVLESVRPDFYYSLHNTRAGGAFIGLSRGIGPTYHAKIQGLLQSLDFPVQERAPWKEVCESFAPGIAQVVFMRKLYDYLEKMTPAPHESPLLQDGANDWDYVADIMPAALSMYAETGCLRHPYDRSTRESSMNLRALRLRIDAISKYVASVLHDQWAKVKGQLDATSSLYRAVDGYVLQPLDRISQGGWPLSRYPTCEILLDPGNDRLATEGEIFNVCVMDGGLYFIQLAYQFVRLLRASRQTPPVKTAADRAERALAEARTELGRYIDLAEFQFFDLDTLAKVQVGCGLVVLNSVLEGRST